MSLIGNLDDFPDNSAHGIHSGGRALLIVRSNTQLYVYENLCPHTRETLDPEGGSVASSDGLLIQCQRHAANFIAQTGECVGGPCLGESLNPVPFTLSGGDIYLD
ncbi:MAG: Rieske 2Fe-2S domain-containing protein [Halioglobus sp.]|nr:Rieske 2Fe-2S domain-containing protein [Halioglobus sp.]